MRLGGRLYTIVGVMPPSFQSFPQVDVWMPFPFRTDPQGVGINYQLVGRLRADRPAQAAAAELEALAPLLEQTASRRAGRGRNRLGIRSFQEVLGQSMLAPLVLLGAAVAVFLLIVCLNMAGLLAARAAARHQEFAVRTALGGTPGRLARQLVTESLLIAISGGALGLLAAGWSIEGTPGAASRHRDVGRGDGRLGPRFRTDGLGRDRPGFRRGVRVPRAAHRRAQRPARG